MSRRKVIETLGIEAEVLAMAQRGLTNRQIARDLKAQGHTISYTAVQRFLAAETKDRQAARRVATAARATEIAVKAGEDADDNLARLRDLVEPLGVMATRAVRRVAFPDEAMNLRPAQDASEDDQSEQGARIDEGQREWWEPIAAKDQIRAAAVAKDLLAYMVELAGANPRPTDPKNLEAIRQAIADVFGYSTAPASNDPQEAPLSPEEHTPPVMH